MNAASPLGEEEGADDPGTVSTPWEHPAEPEQPPLEGSEPDDADTGWVPM